MGITENLRSFLEDRNLDAFGFADITCLPAQSREGLGRGIVMGLAHTPEAIEANRSNDARQYYDEYHLLNKTLADHAFATAELLTEQGYSAIPMPQYAIEIDEDNRTTLPYKTVATLAGIGWIGKCALLVTEEFGSGIRLVTVLTDAPLEPGRAQTESKCLDNCMVCTDVCPGHAPKGRQWHQRIERDEFFDAAACGEFAFARMRTLLQVEEQLCGICMANCPYTRRAIKRR